MSRLFTFIAGGALGTAITWAALRPAAASPPEVPEPVAVTEASIDAGVKLLPRPTAQHAQTFVPPRPPSLRQREVADHASELQPCGDSVAVLTVATAQLSISDEGAVRPKRLVIDPASEHLSECLREKLANLRVSKSNEAEEVQVRFRFEPH